MAYLTMIPVPEATTELMKQFNFTQVDAISPNIKWVNLKGIAILHHSSQIPSTVDDVVSMIHTTGINIGAYEQMQKIKNGIANLVEKFTEVNRLIHQEPVRADSSLLTHPYSPLLKLI